MNQRRWTGTFVMFTCLALAACGMLKRDPGPVLITTENIARLQDKEWELRAITIDGAEEVMHLDARMGIRFDTQGHVQGQGGVNQFAGTYRIDDAGKLAWGATGFVTTRKGGAPEFMDKERVFLDALRRTTRAIAGKVILTLQSENAEIVLTFLRPGSL